MRFHLLRIVSLDIPGWFLCAAAVIFILVLLGSLAWGILLSFQYARPYTLNEATLKQIWLWSVHLSFWGCICLLDAVGVLVFMDLCCVRFGGIPKVDPGSFLTFFVLMVLFWRLLFNLELEYYRRLSRAIRSGEEDRPSPSALSRLLKSTLSRFSPEFRRFYQEGFSRGPDPGKKS